jgi:Fe-S-cluster containining protein
MKQKIEKLKSIYDAFEEKTAAYRSEAACTIACAFCCTAAGSIDATSLEVLVIREHIGLLPRVRQKSIQKALAQDIRKREAGIVLPCPFLQKNKACMIYGFRPFACRRIYSLHTCSKDNPPMLNRHVMEEAEQTLKELQQLDDTGYSGHISFIFFMLNNPRFLDTYLAGDFKPEEIMDFGKTHRISINNMMK